MTELTVKEKLKLIIDLGGSLERECLEEIQRLESVAADMREEIYECENNPDFHGHSMDDSTRRVCGWVRYEEDHRTFWISECGSRLKHQSGAYCQHCGKVISRTWLKNRGR